MATSKPTSQVLRASLASRPPHLSGGTVPLVQSMYAPSVRSRKGIGRGRGAGERGAGEQGAGSREEQTSPLPSAPFPSASSPLPFPLYLVVRRSVICKTGVVGIEPTTSEVEAPYSIQLSYTPNGIGHRALGMGHWKRQGAWGVRGEFSLLFLPTPPTPPTLPCLLISLSSGGRSRTYENQLMRLTSHRGLSPLRHQCP